LKGETAVMLREETAGSRIRASRDQIKARGIAPRSAERIDVGDPSLLAALRAWRSQVRASAAWPAYVVLHDSTIDGIATSRPTIAHTTPRHPRHRRQEARTLRRRADRAGEGQPH